jgi:hypothetical protein
MSKVNNKLVASSGQVENLSNWKKYYKRNNYYHSQLHELVKRIIPETASVLEIDSKGGETLAALPNKEKTGVVLDENFVKYAKSRNPKINFITYKEFPRKLGNRKYDYVLLSHALSEIEDVQLFLQKLKRFTDKDTRIVVLYFNYLWKPLLDFGERVGLKRFQQKVPNWLSQEDIDNFFSVESYELIKTGKKFLCPYPIPVIAPLFNKYLSPLPLINLLCLINYAVYKPSVVSKNCGVSIVIPARNEEGNMRGVLSKIPILGTKMEVVFVEGHSKDDTYQVIRDEISRYKGPIKARLYKQKGKGKGDAVRLGFSKAKNDLLMILDADLTVDPRDLPKFYKAMVEGKADFIMGSRLVYPMEKEAMRTLNVFGNKIFSILFTFLLDQKIKDTLCGTKVLFKKDYEKIANNRKYFGDFDPFGDYDLIFGAAKLNLKIMEIPIRYKERTYGKTNISRFTHGLLLLKMVMFAANKIKFI